MENSFKKTVKATVISACMTFTFANNAKADIPAPPTINSAKMSSENLDAVYNLMSSTEVLLQESAAGHMPVVRTFQRIARYTLQAKDTIETAIICVKQTQKSFGGRESSSFDCNKIEGINISLPANDSDLLKLIKN
jgi:hypothetical protein